MQQLLLQPSQKVPDVSRQAFETFSRYLKIENQRLCSLMHLKETRPKHERGG